MSAGKRGIVLPVVLGVLLALAALASLGFDTATREWRMAALARDRVDARAAAIQGLGALSRAPDLAGLCVRPPLAAEEQATTAAAGGTIRSRWRHLGSGVVRGEVEGRGPRGSRYRFIALLRPDSSEWSGALYTCPSATRLVPLGPAWLEGHPEG